jgi:TetR/AcrR family transcriptional regulator, regulator of autoinduction and epiphytic fitness
MADGVAGPIDGRLARSQRTRRAIVDALRSLHVEGDLRPTAPRVAERAGVSVRTVWQHFQDLETLFIEAGRRDLEIARGFVRPIAAELPLVERIAALIEQRIAMFEHMAPVWRAARLQEPFSLQLQSTRDRLFALGREQLAAVFATEIHGKAPRDGARTLDAIQSTTSWAIWESLRHDLHLSVEEAATTVTLLLTRLLIDREART